MCACEWVGGQGNRSRAGRKACPTAGSRERERDPHVIRFALLFPFFNAQYHKHSLPNLPTPDSISKRGQAGRRLSL